MGELILINQKRVFTIEEARELLPIIRRITQQAHNQVKFLGMQLSLFKEKSKKAKYEEKIQEVFQAWHEKIRKLGCDAKGMWLVDFDSGEGYYCWHYPENTVDFYHGYVEGFRGRVRIQ